MKNKRYYTKLRIYDSENGVIKIKYKNIMIMTEIYNQNKKETYLPVFRTWYSINISREYVATRKENLNLHVFMVRRRWIGQCIIF